MSRVNEPQKPNCFSVGCAHYSLCGLTVEKIIPSKDDFDPAIEDDCLPQMVETSEKVTCPDCIQIIRYCLKLGEKSIARGI